MPTTTEIQQQMRIARRTGREGMTLIEIMIAITIIAMVVGGVAVAVLPNLEKARIKTTQTDAQAMRSAVTLYRADNPRGCPTVDDLMAGQYLDATKRKTDAWDLDFQIKCEGSDVAVISAGSDGQFGTEDDIQ